MKHLLLPILFVLLSSTTPNAQDLPYTFSVVTDTYTELSNANDLSQGEIWDDPLWQTPIGFTFEIFDSAGDTLYLPEFTGPFFTFDPPGSQVLDYIIGYGNDLIDRGSIDNSNALSPVSYITSGTSPNRIYKLEYKNAGFYDELDVLYTLDNFVNIQIWLYEGSNDIEIHFGPSHFDESFSDFDYFSGAFVGFWENQDEYNYSFDNLWYLIGEPADPTVYRYDANNLDTIVTVINGHPIDGTIYRFSAIPPSSIDQLTHEDQFKLFPTLVENTVQIEITESTWIGDQALFQIIDNSGRVLFSKKRKAEALMNMDISHFPAGTYHLTCFLPKAQISRKFVKI